MSAVRAFRGPALSQIAFPLGGIGTGTVSLGGRGNLQDWELFNRPGKGNTLARTFLAIRAHPQGGAPAARVLEREYLPPFIGALGFKNNLVPSLPRFREATFEGAYPFARIGFEDDAFPAGVSLEAFSPFVPMDVAASSHPCAILNYRVCNPGPAPLSVSLLAVMRNPVAQPLAEFGSLGWGIPDSRVIPYLGVDGVESAYAEAPGFRGLSFTAPGLAEDDLRKGSAALTTPWPDVDVATTLRQVGWWWDALQETWDNFLAVGRLEDTRDTVRKPIESGAICLRAEIPPGGEVVLPILIHWHFPRTEMWGGDNPVPARTYVGVQFADAWDAAVQTHRDLAALEARSRAFADAFWTSDLPAPLLDAAGSALSTLRSPTVMRLDDGRIYAWEGSGDQIGSCAGNCTHVWNYEQALAFLFPELERTMREIEFAAGVRADGAMSFRCEAPIGAGNTKFHETPACADGQMGAISQLYRDWQLSGDEEFLRALWPNAKRALEYAWTCPNGWDPNQDGVMEGSQHNTYDIEFYGPNTMTGSLYLAALQAGERIARHLGDEAAAAQYHSIYETGRARIERELWNGEYFTQHVAVMNGLRVPRHLATPRTDPVVPKYQYGEGCLSDQLLGQWQAHVCGLGAVLDPEKTRSAVRATHKHNFRRGVRGVASVQRAFALQDEAGLLLCSWPNGGRPAQPFVYSDEVWTGIEYQVAAHLIYEGLVDEALEIVTAVRARYDGVRRNPWDEIECGHHYARALSSWSLIQAMSGARYSAVEQSLTFAPKFTQGRVFVAAGQAWGVAAIAGESVTLEIIHGALKLRRFGHAGRPQTYDSPRLVAPGAPLSAP